MPDRTISSNEYRYGFNGMEKNEEINEGASYTTPFRQFDSRIGRWLSVDPKANLYYSWSPYSLSLDNPIRNSDPSGATVNPTTGGSHQNGSGGAAPKVRNDGGVITTAAGAIARKTPVGRIVTIIQFLKYQAANAEAVEQQRTNGLNAKVSELKNKIDNLATKIDDLDTKLDELEENLGLNQEATAEESEDDSDQFITFYRGVGAYDAMETEAAQQFDIEKIITDQAGNPSIVKGLYFTTQTNTAAFFGSVGVNGHPHPGGYAVLRVSISRKDFQNLLLEFPDTIFEQPIPDSPTLGMTETLIPIRAIKFFEQLLKRYPEKINIDHFQYE